MSSTFHVWKIPSTKFSRKMQVIREDAILYIVINRGVFRKRHFETVDKSCQADYKEQVFEEFGGLQFPIMFTLVCAIIF